jgi:hypothetical protein
MAEFDIDLGAAIVGMGCRFDRYDPPRKGNGP